MHGSKLEYDEERWLGLVRQKAQELAETHLSDEPYLKIFLFGSRATGEASSRSDIDIGIDAGHPLDPVTKVRLQEQFDAVPLLQPVQVVDFAAVDPSFKQVAMTETRLLYERKAA